MSSSRPPDVVDGSVAPLPRRGRLRGPHSLRTKLIVSMVGLIVAVCAVVGVVTEIFLSRHLLQQLDTRLVSAQQRGPFNPRLNGETDDPDGPPSNSAGCSTPDSATAGSTSGSTSASTSGSTSGAAACSTFRNQQDGLSFAFDSTGATVFTRAIKNYSQVSLSTQDQATIKAAVAKAGLDHPVSVSLSSLGDYRISAQQPPNRAGETLVSGFSLEENTDTQRSLIVILLIVAGGAVLVGAGVVFLTVRRSVRPLERVAATARQVSTLELSRGEVDLDLRVPAGDTDPRTEIGQVGLALNQMLGNVSGALSARHESETRVRQFVADASHELRTPLAAIRGYAELARRTPADQAMTAHSLSRVESESARMTTLVEDLLLLARLDSGRPLAHEEVDLSTLVIDRMSDARVAGPDHVWQLDIPDEPVTVIGDGARLHQVLANLLTNARNHTPPGTVIVTRLVEHGATVEMSVTDNGPGIPADLLPEIFGRFVRGDSSRSRAAGSTGLGLAIVQAVVTAHAGTVSMTSRPGSTTASVVLPRDAAARPAASPATVVATRS